jgi:hypothetical protein
VSHAHLCVLAYLLMRIAENRVEESWPLIREKVERVSVVRIETDHAAIFGTSPISIPVNMLRHPCIWLLSKG